MDVVVADTTPLRYLAEIDQLSLLPRLFQHVIIPKAVFGELQQPSTPPKVRQQLATPLPWLRVALVGQLTVLGLDALDEGERAAIALAIELHAQIILIDERRGTTAAAQKGFETIGTLGILIRAARLGMVDLELAFDKLKSTSFRCGEGLLRELLAKYRPS